MKNLSKTTLRIIAAGILLIIFIVISYVAVQRNNAYISELNDYTHSITYDPFDNIPIIAESAYVYDTKDDMALFSKGSDKVLPLASITKFMTIFTAAEALPPEFPIMITPDALATAGESGLIPYEEWKFSDLAAYTLIVSSNDGAQAIANAAEEFFKRTEGISFVEKMNKKAENLSMSKSVFYNPTGLDESLQKAGSYSNAEDVTILVDYMLRLHPKLVDDTQIESSVFHSSSGFSHTATNTNREIESIPGLIASKTGFTDLAGGNLVVAAELPDNRIIIITVIGSTRDGRFSDTINLYNAALKHYEVAEKIDELETTIGELLMN